jgi:magnesium transporter
LKNPKKNVRADGVEPSVFVLSGRRFAVKLSARLIYGIFYNNFVIIFNMIYFSQILKKKVFTEDGIKVGYLDDLVFLNKETPIVTKLLIKTKDKKILVPIDFLVKINKEIYIQKNYEETSLSDDELYILRNLLDKQIIDIKGSKIVRVNDVVLQKEKNDWYVLGVDVGVLGILRRLGLSNLGEKILGILRLRLSSQFLSWAEIQPLELARGEVRLKKEEKKLLKLRPEDLADYLEQTSLANIQKVLRLLDKKMTAKVIADLNINYQVGLFQRMLPKKAASILELLDSDEAVDILLFLSKKRREAILSFLPKEKQKEVSYLLIVHESGKIGDYLSLEYLAVSPSKTVLEVKNLIKKETADFYFLPYIYVLNEKKQLIGVFSLHELLLQDDASFVYKFMNQNLITVYLTTPINLALRKMIKYKISALPVIDKEKRLLGIVTFDDLSEKLYEKIFR